MTIKTLYTDFELMQSIRSRIDVSEKHLDPALDQLKEDAEAALKLKPFSVVHTKELPPSGDPHDYMSFSIYDWQDPDNPGQFIKKDGQVNPAHEAMSDKPFVRRLSAAVQTLALAYFFSRDEKYAEHAARLIRVWFLDQETRMNPHLTFGQMKPGDEVGAFSSIIDTRWLVMIVDMIGLLQESACWKSEDHDALLLWFSGYLAWLMESDAGKREAEAKNNHGTWYFAQTLSFCLLLGEEARSKNLIEKARPLIEKQVDEDGSQPLEINRTHSFNYSLYNLHGMICLAGLGKHLGIDLWREGSGNRTPLRRAVDYVAPFADPGKTWPHQEISDLNLVLFYDADPDIFYPCCLATALAQSAVELQTQAFSELLNSIQNKNIIRHRLNLLWNG